MGSGKLPRTPKFQCWERVDTGQRRDRLLFSLTRVHPGPNNFNIEIGGAGGRLKHNLCNRLLYSQHRNPININKSRFEVEVSVLCTFLIIYPVHGHRFTKSQGSSRKEPWSQKVPGGLNLETTIKQLSNNYQTTIKQLSNNYQTIREYQSFLQSS